MIYSADAISEKWLNCCEEYDIIIKSTGADSL